MWCELTQLYAKLTWEKPKMLLSLSGVHTYYGLSHILHGVDLHIKQGEVVGLFGRNGVGKTTTLRTIAGWVAPQRGTISLEGQNLEALKQDQIARSGVAFVPEDRRIFPGLTVEENINLGLLQNPKLSKFEAQESVQSVYRRFPRLRERRTQAGITLSGGEQQMLTLARALVGKPRLVLIDEPSEGLAPMIVDDIFNLLLELKNEGVSVLLVEQNVVRSLQVVDRFYAMRRGTITLAGEASSEEDKKALLDEIAL